MTCAPVFEFPPATTDEDTDRAVPGSIRTIDGLRVRWLSVSRRPALGEAGERRASVLLGGEVEIRHGDARTFVNFVEHRSPGVDDRRVAVCLELAAELAHLSGGDDEHLVLDCPRPQKDLPVETACRSRERGRDHYHERAGEREDAVKLRESQVVADSQADRAQGARRTAISEAIVARLPGATASDSRLTAPGTSTSNR